MVRQFKDIFFGIVHLLLFYSNADFLLLFSPQAALHNSFISPQGSYQRAYVFSPSTLLITEPCTTSNTWDMRILEGNVRSQDCDHKKQIYLMKFVRRSIKSYHSHMWHIKNHHKEEITNNHI